MPAYATPSLSCKAPALCRGMLRRRAVANGCARLPRMCVRTGCSYAWLCIAAHCESVCVFVRRRVRACHHKECFDTCLSMSLVLTTSSGQVAAAAIAPAKAPHVADCSGSHGDTCNSPTKAEVATSKKARRAPSRSRFPWRACMPRAGSGSMNRRRDRRGHGGRTARDERGKSLGQEGRLVFSDRRLQELPQRELDKRKWDFPHKSRAIPATVSAAVCLSSAVQWRWRCRRGAYPV
jgi:hypothetical protein